MRTGLPIVYNDVGAYTERLVYRTNAFPVDGHDAHAVLRTLHEATSTRGCQPSTHSHTSLSGVRPQPRVAVAARAGRSCKIGTRRCRMS